MNIEIEQSKTPDLHESITVNASAEVSIKKISQVNLWWAKNFKGNATKLNDKFSVYFGGTFVDFKISELIPNQKVVWLVEDCNLQWINDKKEWKNTEVVFTLSEKDGKTKIDLLHKGLTPDSECYESCKVGWKHHLIDGLQKLVNEGKGYPE